MEYLFTLISEKRSIFEISLFRAIDFINEKLKQSIKETHKNRLVATCKSQKFYMISSIFTLLWITAIIVFLMLGFIQNTVSFGLLVSVVVSLESILSSCDELSIAILKISNASIFMTNLDKIFNAEKENMPTESENRKNDIYTIVFDHVSFKYPKTETFILEDISLEFKTDEKIAIVGMNGEGKSTIVKLLLNLFRPTIGEITISGKAISEYTRSEIAYIFCAVFQECNIYEFSIADNIIFGRFEQNLSEKLFERFEIADSNLDSQLGYLNKEGTELSGGQIQRINIARALFEEPKFIILDEPSAQLDPIIESEIYEMILNDRKEKGCLLITHRLASVQYCNKIYVLNEKKITESGNHEELMQINGLYQKFFINQQMWYNYE
jgi:ABC-type multidrug transport system fused ATPase/permease subunit